MDIQRRSGRNWHVGLWAVAVAVVLGSAPAGIAQPAGESQPAEVRVGLDEGDFRGGDHRALQAAVDYVAGLGGGTVRIGPGRYLMRNALTLRDNVRVVGVPGKTVLAACDGFKTPLAADGDCNERQITLADPSGFQVGDGVSIQDKNAASGFAVTTATLTARLDANTFRISMPLYLDYMVSNARLGQAGLPDRGRLEGEERLDRRPDDRRQPRQVRVPGRLPRRRHLSRSTARRSRSATASSASTTATASVSRPRST